MTNSSSSLFGFLRPHASRGKPLMTGLDWLKGKSASDRLQDVKHWRIHDKEYDLTDFNHPGGNEWIELTRGGDITELFESSHPDIEKVTKLLPKYEVKTKTKAIARNSGAFTFEKNGFYSVFRKRAFEALKSHGGCGPTPEMLYIHDCTLFLFLALYVSLSNPAVQLNSWQGYLLYLSCAFALQSLATMSHNYWHQRTNWRMYTWDLSFYSSHDWRITHAISHHAFPNTAYDYELMVFEPFLEFLPVKKGLVRMILTLPVFFLLTCTAFHLQGLQRTAMQVLGKQSFRPENILPFALLVLQIICRWYWVATSGELVEGWQAVFDVCLQPALITWTLVTVISSFLFHNISLGAGHHHPLVWHDGDAIDKTCDWGIFQLISVARFETIDKSLLLTSISFGNHAMHHLLPTVDHSKLNLIRPVFLQTCKEFGITLSISGESGEEGNSTSGWFTQRDTGIMGGWVGMIMQAFRSQPSTTNFPFALKRK